MNIWKIVPWSVPSTNRTAPPIEIVGFRISYTDGVIGVVNNNDNPIVLIISYFDSDGRERAFLKDNISAPIIQRKGAEMGLTGIALEGFVNDTMHSIITTAIGGSIKEERFGTICALAQMYGQTMLPFEEQDGIIQPLTAP